jgi:site-specific recombinase XerD
MAKTNIQTELNQRIREFLEYCEVEKQHSQLTIQNYEHYLRRFSGWAAEHGTSKPADITIDTVRQYRLWLNRLSSSETREPIKRITQNYHVIALRAFLKYLAKRDIQTLPAEKIELGKVEKRTVEFLNRQEVDRLRQSAGGDSFSAARDRAILELLFSTGLRVSELTNLNTEMVSVEHGEFMVRGKGDKPRVVFLSDEAGEWVGKYLEKRGVPMKPLFTRTNKQKEDPDGSDLRLTPRSIQRIIKKYATRAGIVKDITPHTLRHSFATDLLQNGADIRSVQQMLGHSSITTTQVYTHVTNQQLRSVHQRFHGKTRPAD